MTPVERFNEVIELLLAERSPVARVQELGVQEQRMLLVAQCLRGSRQRAPDPLFVERLRLELAGRAKPAPALQVRRTW